ANISPARENSCRDRAEEKDRRLPVEIRPEPREIEACRRSGRGNRRVVARHLETGPVRIALKRILYAAEIQPDNKQHGSRGSCGAVQHAAGAVHLPYSREVA